MINKHFTIITARSRSSRYPEKILEKIAGNFRSIDILIKRAEKIGLPIILATSNLDSDNKLCKYVSKNYEIKIFRGSSKNKIHRWYECFKKYNISSACMVDGDDLSFDFNIYKQNKNRREYISLNNKSITGIFMNIMDKKSLSKIYTASKGTQDTEMIEPFLKRAKIKSKYITKKIYLNKDIRLTFDYPEDKKVFSILYNNFKITEDTAKIVKYLIKNKEISKINYFREKFWSLNQKKKINKVRNSWK